MRDETAFDTGFEAGADALPSLLDGVRARARQLSGTVLDFLLPPQCMACRTRTAAGDGVCARCWSGLEFIERPYCPRTGRPFVYDPGAGIVAAAALARPGDISRVRAAVRFGDVARRMVHGLKYADRLEFAPLVSRLMLRAGRDLVEEADLIMPVPLHRRRLWQRRYNQSALLGGRLARLGGGACDTSVLVRVRPTQAQVGLSRTERRRNVRNAFDVRDGARARVKGRAILLVDDVLTTGATAEACARTLLDAGADRVDLLVFAMVCDPVSALA